MSRYLSVFLLFIALAFLSMPAHAISSSAAGAPESCACAYSDAEGKKASKAKKKERRAFERAFFVGVFLFVFGLAAGGFYALAASTLAVFRILLVLGSISLVVGDVLMCRYGQICILRNVFTVLSWFWWL